MKAEVRRKEIASLLMSRKEPLSGSALSEMLGVSRQIIVGDIAILKAAGYDILSTHQGYVMQGTPQTERVFKTYHTTEQTADELSCIVDLGGTVVDVFVWHKVYGRIDAPLNIFSRYQVDKFIEGVRSGKSTELMTVTGGYHYHTVRADSEETLNRIGEVLAERGYIVPEVE